jgi:hypothetical protein
MKMTLFLLMGVLLSLAISCQPSSAPENASVPLDPALETTVELEETTGGIKDTISLATANEWVCNFQSYMDGGISSQQWDDIKADGFLIPEVDLTELIGEQGVVNVRAYLGLRQDGPADTLKLVLVGVDNQGNDLLSIIADLTSPCPPDCGTVNDIIDCK